MEKKMNMLLTFDTAELNYHATYHLKALDKYYSNIYIYLSIYLSIFLSTGADPALQTEFVEILV